MGGADPGAIPVSEVIAYLREFGPEESEERSDWLHLIQEADGEWLDATNGKMKAEQEAKKPTKR